MTKQLKMLPVNKTVIFYSPIEGEDVLVRTGTIGEGSCFYHSLLHAYSKEYIAMDNKGRMKFVGRLRASMAGNVDKENWESIGGGLIAKIPFQENVHNILMNFYRFIANDTRARGQSTRKVIKNLIGDNEDTLNLYKIITELIPIEKFEQKILPDAYAECEEELIEQCKEAIIVKSVEFAVNTLKGVDKSRVKYIKNEIVKFVHDVVEEAENSAFKAYTNGLQNVSEEVDSYTIGLISDRFDRDIYFIDSRTRMPYLTADTENIKGRKSLIVMWIEGNHYEIVGRLLPGNRIQREFSKSDNLIQKLNAFVCHPETVSERFPELTSYLPRQHRTGSPSPSPSPTRTRRMSDSEDDSDNYSDSDSDLYSSSEDEDEDE